MPNNALNQAVAIGIIVFLVGLGVAIGYLIWGRQVVPVVEDFAPAIEQDDGSRVLSREPDGRVETPAAKVPKGHTVIRTVEVTVAPHVDSGFTNSERVDETGKREHDRPPFCPPVTVRLDLLRAPDGTMRVLANSADGEILDGVDIPREPVLVAVRRPWTVGYERTIDGKHGAFIARDIGRLVVGVSATESDVTGRIGWRF